MVSVLACLALSGCESSQQGKKGPAIPTVPVSKPIVREVTDYEEFTGRLASPEEVSVRARVTGYLDKVFFKDGIGVDVKVGQKLFEIDKRPYQVKLDQAKADLESARANVVRAQALYDRAYTLARRGAGTQEDVDKLKGDLDVARAAIDQAQAKVAEAQLNLDFCTVTAPVEGRLSRRLIDPGNLVQADTTILTTIRRQNPLFAYFDVDERTVLTIRRLIKKGAVKSAKYEPVVVEVGLADEEGFPHQGLLDFVENTVEPGTGTLRVRAVFDNDHNLMSPGLFVRVRVRVGTPYKALLVAEAALGQDQAQRFVYVVSNIQVKKDPKTGKDVKEGVVTFRPVQVGALHQGLRVIEKGVGPEDWIIVNGLQRVRPDSVVQIAERPMPEPRIPGQPSAAVSRGGAAKGKSSAKR
jgi:RND family efflux transporter MFP subunit